MDKKHMQITPRDRSFVYKSKWQRFMATFGGPFMNFVLAFFIYLIIAFIAGVPNLSSAEIGSVSENTPAGILVGEDEEGNPVTLIRPGDVIVSINGVTIDSWNGDTNSVSSELSVYTENYDIVLRRDGELVTLEDVIPQLIFYGLGFTSTPGSDELVINNPLYIDSELKNGDILISIDSVMMSSWANVIDFAMTHTEGSVDKEDLYDFQIFRTTFSEVEGTVTSITRDDDSGFTEIIITTDDPAADSVIYNVKNSETILVEVGSLVAAGTELSSGAEYTFTHIIYGVDVLEAMGYQVFYSRLGISSTNHFDFFGSFAAAWNSFVAAGTSIFKTLGLLFSSNLVGVSDLSGFIGIFSMTSTAAAAGLISLLSWVGLLSVNLGIVNLLPLPALDGGRIIFIGYEAITGKKPNQKLENMLHTIMFFLLMALLVFITYNDILRLFGLK